MTTDLLTPTSLDESVATWERAVLGAALHSPVEFEKCQALLRGSDFYNPAHEYIWDAIAWLNAQGDHENRVKADPALVMARLADQGRLGVVGGGPYLLTLYSQTITTTNAVHYARRVKNASNNRKLAALGARINQAGEAGLGLEDRNALLGEVREDIDAIAASDGPADPTPIIGASLADTLDALEHGNGSGITTGLAELDELLGGLTGGQVVVIGARPGVGKTVAAQQVVTAVARDQKKPALLFTMEMDRSEMMGRILAAEAGVNGRRLNLARPDLTERDWEKIAGVMGTVTEMPLYVCDEPAMTPSRLIALIGAFKRKHPDLGVVVIDYIGLMESDKSAKSRQEEIATISRQLKLAAKRFNVPIVVLSQLNRNSTHRSDNMPALSDLRDSGAVEQDADIVILLHREDAYERESPRAGEMDLIVAKHRGGPTGQVVVAAQMHYFRLASMGAGYGGGGGTSGQGGY